MHKVEFILSKPRKTKLGDYRAIPNENLFIITVNNNSKPRSIFDNAFYMRLAHHVTLDKHKNFVKPHGKEWKQEYQRVFMP